MGKMKVFKFSFHYYKFSSYPKKIEYPARRPGRPDIQAGRLIRPSTNQPFFPVAVALVEISCKLGFLLELLELIVEFSELIVLVVLR